MVRLTASLYLLTMLSGLVPFLATPYSSGKISELPSQGSLLSHLKAEGRTLCLHVFVYIVNVNLSFIRFTPGEKSSFYTSKARGAALPLTALIHPQTNNSNTN
ncbi:unnamed protein product [Cochlearia groenlandica]